MRICDSYRCKKWRELEGVQAGTPIQFRTTFHQDNRRDDIFIVNAVSSTYRPADGKYRGKIGVTNLRSGHLSYVSETREIQVIDAEVMIEREC